MIVEGWIMGIGTVTSIVMTILKLMAIITLNWWWVSAAFLVALGLVLLKNGLDFTDFLPD